ncbi:MarR family winged helix-turn-helix transcriptional regulator [Pseudonocardia xinjiangensis]|uniref:MarR family winged helix-turn-helix transcriptional regulator n=1 Tax=Pseudonocardia xinjiangensis TaxID=75289 RepID=UPI003D905942
MAQVLTTLPAMLERELERHAGLSWMEYHALAMLSEQEGHLMRMSRLAAVTNASLSRLSHLVKRLEARGYLRREPDASDGRFIVAILTLAGRTALVAAAPWHVESVRRFVFDAVGAQDMAVLRSAFDRIAVALDEARERVAEAADPDS